MLKFPTDKIFIIFKLDIVWFKVFKFPTDKEDALREPSIFKLETVWFKVLKFPIDKVFSIFRLETV